jgi:hypothetical protein
MSNIEVRVRSLVDEEVIQVFWKACEHFDCRDMVVFVVEGDEDKSLNAAPREKLLADPALPEFLREKIAMPASSVNFQMTTDCTFWLVALFADGEAASVAINAKGLTPGGNA